MRAVFSKVERLSGCSIPFPIRIQRNKKGRRETPAFVDLSIKDIMFRQTASTGFNRVARTFASASAAVHTGRLVDYIVW